MQINPTVSWADGYGYLWWLKNLRVNSTTVRSFKAIGWGGQEIFVLKDLAMVVVFTGANFVGNVPCDEIMQRYVLPAGGGTDRNRRHDNRNEGGEIMNRLVHLRALFIIYILAKTIIEIVLGARN